MGVLSPNRLGSPTRVQRVGVCSRVRAQKSGPIHIWRYVCAPVCIDPHVLSTTVTSIPPQLSTDPSDNASPQEQCFRQNPRREPSAAARTKIKRGGESRSRGMRPNGYSCAHIAKMLMIISRTSTCPNPWSSASQRVCCHPIPKYKKMRYSPCPKAQPSS